MSKKKSASKPAKKKQPAQAGFALEELIGSTTIQKPTTATASYQGAVGVNRQVFVEALVVGNGDQPMSVMAGTSAQYPASPIQSLTRQGSSNIWSGWVMLMSTTYFVRVEAAFTVPPMMMTQIVPANSAQLTDPG
jgi:hypothetical protein